MATTDLQAPFEGIRVLDLTAIVSGPLATLILAEQGADVVKVEPPGTGDLTRHMGPRRGDVSAIFAAVNRNKRSLCLDLRNEEGRGVLRRLIDGADVVVQNFRPGAIERMGFAPAECLERNPRLVFCSITGFGPDGPYAQRGVFDPLIQAVSGLADAQGQRPGETGRKPELVRAIVCDKLTGLWASQAISAALFARERTGAGRHVELSMLDASLAFHWCDVMWNHSFTDGEESPFPELADMFRVSPTADGWIIVTAAGDAQFADLCAVLGDPSVAVDPRFATLPDRMANIAELLAWQEGRLAERTSEDLCAALSAKGVPCAAVNRIVDLPDDPQIRHNGSLGEIRQPQAGTMRFARHPVRCGAPVAPQPAPGLGEHGREVLAEAGFSDEEIVGLEARRVLI